MASHIWIVENSFLSSASAYQTNPESTSTCFKEDYCNGRYWDIINSNKSHEIFKNCTEDIATELTWLQRLQNCITNYANNNNQSEEIALEILLLGVSALQYFVRLNWTGPDDPSSVSCPEMLQDVEGLTTELALDAEDVCSVLQGPQWLLLARTVLVNSPEIFSKHQKGLELAVSWWALRCVSVHQAVLEETSPQLHSELAQLQARLVNLAPWLAKEISLDLEEGEEQREPQKFHELEDAVLRQVRALLWVELASARLQYSEVHKSRICLQQALNAIGLEAHLIGALGKRTWFQEKALPQLTLRVSTLALRSGEQDPQMTPPAIEDLPRDIKLNDDVRRPQTNFVSEEDGKVPSLSPVEQAVLLACFGQVLKSQPKDEYAQEELLPYLNCILAQPQAWPIQLSALLARCKLEAFHRRTVERSMTQAQLLVDCISAERPDSAQRLRLIYASHLPPRWTVEAELASLLISLGAVNSALDIFLRLRMWENVIACYHLLELRHKAAEVVRQELEAHPSPRLWCMLGDATDDVSCYETAWLLSKERSAQAQRHWGFHFYFRKENEKSIPHLALSLQLNALQPLVLSRLAFAYLELEDWTNCARTYRQLCTLDNENFEAWNNLAKAYVKLGEKARAWKVLQESIKCNFENWQVWDNLMVVSIDCTEYQEAMRAYHRLLDLRGSHVDTQVLGIIVQAVTENLPENRGQNAGRLRKKALELFGRLTSIVANDAKVWQLYARLVSSEPTPHTPQCLEKVVQLLQRAQRCATQTPNWFRETESCKEAVAIIISLTDTCLELSSQTTTPSDGVRLIASPRLTINSMLTKIKTQHTDAVTGSVPEELAETVSKLAAKMEELVQRNKSLLATT